MSGNFRDKVYPVVSALIVARNEQDYIMTALLSLINQDYPANRFEIIVVDGESCDDTVRLVKEIINKYEKDGPHITLLNNPKHSLSAGWNIGIMAAKGEYITRIDAHAKAMPDFLSKSVETIQSADAVCVGGKLITTELDKKDSLIAKILSSPFGVGNSSFRVSDKAGYVDTAVYGLYDKAVFDEVGLFHEGYLRNQDLQMHSRIRRAGGKFYFEPLIQSEYYVRNTVGKMVKQALLNGYWNMRLLIDDRSGLSIRHLVPFAFVLFLIIFLSWACSAKWPG